MLLFMYWANISLVKKMVLVQDLINFHFTDKDSLMQFYAKYTSKKIKQVIEYQLTKFWVKIYVRNTIRLIKISYFDNPNTYIYIHNLCLFISIEIKCFSLAIYI